MKVKFKIKFLKLSKKTEVVFYATGLKSFENGIMQKKKKKKKKKKHNLDFQTDVYAAYNKRIKITD